MSFKNGIMTENELSSIDYRTVKKIYIYISLCKQSGNSGSFAYAHFICSLDAEWCGSLLL